MNYVKPEVIPLNAATAAIQGQGKSGMSFDNISLHTLVTVAAYLADE
jgi:hypothetical protein